MKKATKSDIERTGCSHENDVPLTNSCMYFFQFLNLHSFLVSHEDVIILQQATKRAHPRKTLPVYLK